MKKSRLAIIGIISALVFFGVWIGHRSWWLRKIVRETEQEIVDAEFKLKKLVPPISPQLEAPVSIDTLEQFMEEAKTVGVDTIYYFQHEEGASFYIGRKGMYQYSYDLKIVPASGSLFPKYVMSVSFTPSEKQAIEIARLFLDGVRRKTGKVLSVQLEERKPNFYWDVVVESDVEWDRLDVWDRMLKYNRRVEGDQALLDRQIRTGEEARAFLRSLVRRFGAYRSGRNVMQMNGCRSAEGIRHEA